MIAPASRAACALLLAVAGLSPSIAAALDRFEIQVYESGINEPGQLGLELHLNYTADGTTEPEFAGQIPPDHVGRITFEPAVGVTEWLELGAYLQLMFAPGGDARYGGAKVRGKLVVPERISGEWMLGLNVELGRVPEWVEQEQWANEFRPILGWKGGRWTLVANPILGYALTGPDRFRLDFEPCGKVAFDTRLGFSVGLEYYAGLGFVNDILPASEQEHLLFAVVDLVPRPVERASSPARESAWELNLGVGKSLTSAPGPSLLVKAIVGKTF